VTAPAERIPRKLGCASTYTAQVWWWDRSIDKLRFYTELTNLTQLSWERVLDDFSEARIRFRPRKGDDCCGKLKPIFDAQGNLLEPGIWPWAHELAIFRDGELVWMGPIFSIDETVLPDESTDFIQITARDFLGWLDRRAIGDNIYFGDDFYDLSIIAEAIIRDAFAADDPGVLEHLVIRDSNRKGKRSVRYWEAKSGDELREVARGGLDFTCIGRAIIVGSPKRDETQPSITLRSRDFQAGIEIRIVGAEAATAGIAVGAAPVSEDPEENPEDIPPLKAYFGGPDPFFGLIEKWTRSEGTSDLEFLEWVAKNQVSEGNPPPMTLSIPADSGLSPNAPVSIHHLVPSTYFIVAISGTCRALSQYMRLSHVRVTWEADQAEKVGVTFIPQSVLEDEPVPPEEG
jgi:hypothetical protein